MTHFIFEGWIAGESGRAASYLVSKGKVSPDGRDELAAEVEGVVQRIFDDLTSDVEPLPPPPEPLGVNVTEHDLTEDVVRSHTAHSVEVDRYHDRLLKALFLPDDGADAARMDSAIAKEIRLRGDDDLADEIEASSRDIVSKNRHPRDGLEPSVVYSLSWKWRTYNTRSEDGLDIEPVGTNWPPEASGMVGFEGGRPSAQAPEVQRAFDLELQAADGDFRKALSNVDILRLPWVRSGWEPAVRFVGLAEVLWREEVEPRIAERRAKPGSVAVAVLDPIITQMTKQGVLRDIDDGVLRDNRGKEIGRVAVTDADTIAQVRYGLDLFSTLGAHRLFKHLILTVNDRFNDGRQAPQRVTFVGGWRAMATAMGVTRSKYDEIRAILTAGQLAEWGIKGAGTEGHGLWTWAFYPSAPGRASEVVVNVGDPLAPQFVHSIGGKSLAARRARRLVPELRKGPPMGNVRRNEYGAVWTMHRLVLVLMTEGSIDMAQRGGIIITPDRWRRLAAEARLPARNLDGVLDAWLEGESDDAPQLLDRYGDVWTLAEPHELERDFLERAGRRRARSKKGGRRSAQKRKNDLEKS